MVFIIKILDFLKKKLGIRKSAIDNINTNVSDINTNVNNKYTSLYNTMNNYKVSLSNKRTINFVKKEYPLNVYENSVYCGNEAYTNVIPYKDLLILVSATPINYMGKKEYRIGFLFINPMNGQELFNYNFATTYGGLVTYNYYPGIAVTNKYIYIKDTSSNNYNSARIMAYSLTDYQTNYYKAYSSDSGFSDSVLIYCLNNKKKYPFFKYKSTSLVAYFSIGASDSNPLPSNIGTRTEIIPSSSFLNSVVACIIYNNYFYCLYYYDSTTYKIYKYDKYIGTYTVTGTIYASDLPRSLSWYYQLDSLLGVVWFQFNESDECLYYRQYSNNDIYKVQVNTGVKTLIASVNSDYIKHTNGTKAEVYGLGPTNDDNGYYYCYTFKRYDNSLITTRSSMPDNERTIFDYNVTFS